MTTDSVPQPHFPWASGLGARTAAMKVLCAHISGPFPERVHPFRAAVAIFAGFSLSLASLFLAVLFGAGRPNLLASAAAIKPYAVAYRPTAFERISPKNPIIFFGDSSVARVPWAEESDAAIPALLHEGLARPPHPPVVDWSFPGGRLFHYYCLLFEAERYDPALVVIPINWRSLGPREDEWNRTFAYPELSSLVPVEERSFASVRALLRREGISRPRQTLYALHRPMLYLGGTRVLLHAKIVSEPAPPEQKAALRHLFPGEHLIERSGDEALFAQYAVTLADDTASMDALRLIAETAVRRDIVVCFYITPIHLEEMRRRASFDAAAFEESIGRIVASASSETTRCLDLSGLLQEDHFLDNYEHYTLEGNRAIASALAPVVEQLLAP